ncbi:MAG: metal ABC transporter ATP-binding protein [Candidatus Eisenbacteria bacterium]|nr:metal ABC transporter ATP-binding protein [Candidatus Eisenbacteria bacterium]
MSVPAVEVRDLRVVLGGVTILSGIDLTVGRGRFLGVVGPNGGGKSTLLRVLVGLEKPDGGTVRVLGLPPGQSREIGYVPQSPAFDFRFPALVREVVEMGVAAGSRAERRRIVEQVLEETGLAPLSGKPAGSLSGGERQRLFLARALVRRPRLLLLDEPTLGVDAQALDLFLHLLERLRGQSELTVIMVSHDFTVVTTHSDEVICVARGIHFRGSPKDLDEGCLIESYGVHNLFLDHHH